MLILVGRLCSLRGHQKGRQLGQVPQGVVGIVQGRPIPRAQILEPRFLFFMIMHVLWRCAGLQVRRPALVHEGEIVGASRLLDQDIDLTRHRVDHAIALTL